MFIHSIHKIGRVLNIAQILSEMSVAPNHDADTIGLYSSEFVLPSDKNSLN